MLLILLLLLLLFLPSSISTYYDVLKVSPSSTAPEIKKSYRKMSLKHHPDKPGGDEEVFKVRPSEDRNKELARPYLVIKTARPRTSIQGMPPL